MSDSGFLMWGRPFRKLHFYARVFPLVHLILEDIYKIINHSPLGALKSFRTGLNYLHDFMRSGAYFISFELWPKATFKPKPERMNNFAPQEICGRSSRIVTEIRRNEHSVTMRAQCIQRSKVVLKVTFSDIVLNWHYYNHRMQCVQCWFQITVGEIEGGDIFHYILRMEGALCYPRDSFVNGNACDPPYIHHK